MNEPSTFDERLTSFLAAAQSIVDASYANSPTVRPVLSVERGKRYAKIVRRSAVDGSGSVHCFVDTTNGDVLKAASWKAPAKGARSNIFNADFGASGLTPYGARYR